MKNLKITIPAGTVLPAEVNVSIPDPVGSLTTTQVDKNTVQTKLSVTQDDPTSVLTPGTIPVPVDKVFTCVPIPDEFAAPGRGCNMFYSKQSVSIATLDDDWRFDWLSFESTKGVYNFNSLITVLKTCIDNNRKLTFGIVSRDSGKGQIYPSYIGSTVDPDWNSEAYLSGVENLLKACYNTLITTTYKNIPLINAVLKLDIRLLGNWGEWHYFGIAQNYATAASCTRIINAHLNTFQNTRLACTISALTANSNIPDSIKKYLLSIRNTVGLIGIRSDHLGDNGNYKYDTGGGTNSPYSSQILSRWVDAPMFGETMNDNNKVTAGGSTPFWDLENEVRGLHLSQFSNANGTSASQQNFINASKACGYRLILEGGSINGDKVTMNWSNTGIAPVYENWEVYINGVKSSIDIRKIMPGKLVTVDTIPAADSYSIIIKDPTGVRKPFGLAIAGRLADGSYKFL